MDDALIEFFNSLTPFSLGTGLAILVGLVTAGIGLFKGIKKLINHYKVQVISNLNKERELQELKDSLTTLTNSISTLQTSLNDFQTETTQKLNDMHSSIEKLEEDSREGDELLNNKVNSYMNSLEELKESINIINNKTNLLIESDKETIRSYITDKYYECTNPNKGYIEIHTLETVETLYAKYLEENGNTFVGNLMKDLRALPHNKE